MKKGSVEKAAQRFDEIARDYRESTHLPIRVHVDRHSLFRLAGPLQGLSILDLACGEGHYTRLLKQAGAAEVLGVDISPEMIKLAEEAERAERLGCCYRIADVAGLSLGKTFDLVVGVYLLNYAASKYRLVELCHAISRHLKPGGRFIGLNTNMNLDPARYGDYRKYGLLLSAHADIVESDTIRVEYTNMDGKKVSFDNYYLYPSTYESAFAEVGLRDFSWEGLSVSHAGLDAFPDGVWDTLLAAPPTIGIQARK